MYTKHYAIMDPGIFCLVEAAAMLQKGDWTEKGPQKAEITKHEAYDLACPLSESLVSNSLK